MWLKVNENKLMYDSLDIDDKEDDKGWLSKLVLTV